MDAKKALARAIVAQFHGPAEAEAAGERWVKRFSERKVDAAPEVAVAATAGPVALARQLVERGLAPSRKEAERLLAAGAVSLDGEKVSDARFQVDLQPGMALLVKVGKLKLERWVVR